MYKVFITQHFKKQLRILCKKDAALKENFIKTFETFNVLLAAKISGNIYKIRLKKNNRGKSAGYRVYIFLLKRNDLLTPVCIYEKNEKVTLNLSELNKHMKQTLVELQNIS